MSGRLGRLLASRSVASGAVLYIAMRWFDRFVGVISTVVLARLLTPEDFGIVALASIVLGLAVVLVDMGIDTLVVQRPDLDRDDLDTAWTLRLLQGGFIGLLLAGAAPFAADHFKDDRLKGYAGKVARNLTLQPNQLSFFLEHADTDVQHTEETFELLSRCTLTEQQWGWMRYAANTAADLYTRIYDEVGG